METIFCFNKCRIRGLRFFSRFYYLYLIRERDWERIKRRKKNAVASVTKDKRHVRSWIHGQLPLYFHEGRKRLKIIILVRKSINSRAKDHESKQTLAIWSCLPTLTTRIWLITILGTVLWAVRSQAFGASRLISLQQHIYRVVDPTKRSRRKNYDFEFIIYSTSEEWRVNS